MMSEPTEKCPWYQPLCKVTTTSKILAAVIFISLPFVGGYVGYTLAPEKMIAVSVPVSVEDSTAETKPDSGKSIRYILPADWNTYIKYLRENQVTEDKVNFSMVKTIDNVLIVGADEFTNNLGQAPYFIQLIASFDDYFVFCLPPFGKGGTCNWLYKYSKLTNVLKEMNSSSLYNPFYTSAVISPDQTKIALIQGGDENSRGKEIGYINLVDDTYTPIKNISSLNDSIFLDCDEEQITCSARITWLNNETITAEVYPVCALKNSCNASSKQMEIKTMKIIN